MATVAMTCSTTAPGMDLGGFTIPRARIAFKGENANYGYKLQVDFASGQHP